MDIVYLVKNSRFNEELTYSLRTLVNVPHDKVFLVGGCPENIKKDTIIHIPVLQTGNKYQNTLKNLELICRDPRLSEEFILFNDDFFLLLKTTDNPRAEFNLCRGFIKDVYDEYSAMYGNDGNYYIQAMRQTMIFLQDLGIKEPLSYELHIPLVMDKNKVLRAFSLPGIHTIGAGHIRSIYGNLFLEGSRVVADCKIRHRTERIQRMTTNSKFLSSADSTWEYIKPFIQSKFPDKSEYEV